jgi:CO/xanthine dehydrogenase FAD-binding subunit
MSDDALSTYIHYPRNLAELINIYHRRPHALLYAGGNYILKTQRQRYLDFGTDIIYVANVGELTRITRSERTVEIGAAVPVAEVLELGRNVLPGPFLSALRRLGPVGVRHSATLGGNLGVRDEVLTAEPILHLLDARIELRRHGNSRWIPINRLRDEDGSLSLRPGELITRIRVPINAWNHFDFRQFGKPYLADSEPVVFGALARTTKEVLEDLRVAASAGGGSVFRNRELEAELVGRRIPFPARELQGFLRDALSYISSTGMPLTGLQRHRLISLLRDFVTDLPRQTVSRSSVEMP